ncbi:uncharacterized protein LOC129231148 [Uloborus diversus]|uniref:uncharacterized protein LOC129231148 n=1 Tax=Uloborus diversus TaxID=327109 RepID=UPI002409408F|nr:uncharacterized protein LOC129231148 [Uloborus diversus]
MNTKVPEVLSTVLQRLFQRRQRSEKIYTLADVSAHCHPNDCWIVVCDYVYDVTSFLHEHPGGFDVIMEQAGRDATVAVYTAGHQAETIDLLEPLCVGTLAQHERVKLIGPLSSNGHSKDTSSSENSDVTVAN